VPADYIDWQRLCSPAQVELARSNASAGKLTRQLHAIVGACILSALTLCPALAQPTDAGVGARSFEALPIVLVVPYAAGGAASRVATVVADALSRSLQREVQTRHLEGRVGVGALDAVAALSPAEIRLGYATNTQLVEGTLFGSRDSYNALRDFEWIGVIGTLPNAVVVGAKLGAPTFDDWVRGLPGQRPQRWGVGARSSSGHFAAQFLAKAAGVNVELVTFLTADSAYDALKNGEIDANFDLLPNALEETSRGGGRIIAVTSKARAAAAPSIAAFGERWPAEDFTSVAALAIPLKESEEVRVRLRSAWFVTAQDPDTKRRLQAIGVTYSGASLDAAREFVGAEFIRHTKLLTRFQSQ